MLSDGIIALGMEENEEAVIGAFGNDAREEEDDVMHDELSEGELECALGIVGTDDEVLGKGVE